MAKKQTRRSISVSRTTYERLKAFCETNHISMSQLVETRVNDCLGPNEIRVEASIVSPGSVLTAPVSAPRSSPLASTQPAMMMAPAASMRGSLPPSKPVEARSVAPVAPSAAGAAPTAAAPVAPPMTSAAARFAVDPPPPIIKPRQETAAPKPAEKRPDQIFTF